MKYHEYMAHELLEQIKNKEIKVQDVIQEIFERIKEVEKKLHSFVNLAENEALLKAKKIDEQIKRGKKGGRLLGLPLANKDLICIKNFPTTCCSKILQNFHPPYNATVIEKLIHEGGAIHIGNTNMDEFAMGSSTENSCYGPTHNPWALDRVPGGSSGGSGSSVAASQAIAALGSDTGGSIRCPASYCGIVGLKPTYGRVSRYGLVAFANSLDQIGPLTKCVHDAALLLEVMAGKDPLDSTSVDIPVNSYTASLNVPLKNKVIGVPKEYFGDGIEKDVKNAVEKSIEILKELGAKTIDISLHHLEYTVPTYFLLCMSEASSNLARYDGLRYGKMTDNLEGDVFQVYSRTRGEKFGPEVRRRIILGTHALSAGYYDMFYIKALKVRTLIKKDFMDAFKKCDVLVGPTMPTTAFKIGELINDPLSMYMMDALTCPVNLAGLPAISIPCGHDKNHLPIGFQVIGRYFDEKTILNVAYHLEQELNIYRTMPPI